MADVIQGPFWTPWKDTVTGVESLILNIDIAPFIQSFYFTNQCATPDGRYLWFYAAYPPSGDSMYGRLLGVLDAEDSQARVFPETAFSDASPWVDPQCGWIYWVTGLDIWRRGPKPNERPELVNTFPADVAPNRRAESIATHLSLSADRKFFAVDAQIGREWFLGEAPIDGSPMKIWQTFDRCYNHAQFSPTDPDLMLIAQDWWSDPITGERGVIDNRMWLIRRGEEPRPILRDGSRMQVHEWWSSDGRSVWFVDYKEGTKRYELDSESVISEWPAGICHSHADASDSLLVGDISPYHWQDKGCRIAFRDGEGRELDIASSLPLPPMPRSRYHIDPHPQFIMGDRWICYTTTVGGKVSLALTNVDMLVEKCETIDRERAGC